MSEDLPPILYQYLTLHSSNPTDGKPLPVDVLMQSSYINSGSLVQASLKNADVVIEPRVAHIGPGDFHHARECILQGELAAEDCIPKLKRLLSGP